jgi:hypothetical protein
VIRLNLLPPGMGAKGSAFPLASLPWRPIGIGALALLVLYSGWLFFQNRSLSGKVARLTSEWESLQPRQAQIDQTLAALQALQNREAALKTLKSPEGQWAPRLNLLSDCIVANLWFSGLLFRVTRSTEIAAFLKEEFRHQEMLSDFSLPEEQPAINPDGTPVPEEPWKPQRLLRGFALVTGKEGSPVSRFLERLKENPEFSRWFSGVELKDVAHSEVGQQEISEFSVLIYPTGQ